MPRDADERLKPESPLITLPVLIKHGTSDKATEGHVHDLLNDVGKETVMDDIKSWIDTRLS